MAKIFELLVDVKETSFIRVKQHAESLVDVESFIRGIPISFTQKEKTREYTNNYKYGGMYIDTINGTQLCPWNYYIAKLPCGNHVIVPPEIYQMHLDRINKKDGDA